MSWVGRSIRRFEDPTLLLGRGRYTADIVRGAAAVRFVRSPVARGRIVAGKAPEGALVYTAAGLGGAEPDPPVAAAVRVRCRRPTCARRRAGQSRRRSDCRGGRRRPGAGGGHRRAGG